MKEKDLVIALAAVMLAVAVYLILGGAPPAAPPADAGTPEAAAPEAAAPEPPVRLIPDEDDDVPDAAAQTDF